MIRAAAVFYTSPCVEPGPAFSLIDTSKGERRCRSSKFRGSGRPRTEVCPYSRNSIGSQIEFVEAYNLFARRGGGDGHAIEDWINAERQLCSPSAEVVEFDGK